MSKVAGYIYAIGAEGTSLIKIGSTRTNAEDRLKILQTGQPSSLHIIAAIPVESDLRRVEKCIHTFLESERRRGEWFNIVLNVEQLTSLVLRAIEHIAQVAPPEKLRRGVPNPWLMQLGERIRSSRARLRMSQAELARRIGISTTAMNAIEMGTTDPRASRIKAIADVLNVSADYLLGRRSQEGSDREPATLAMAGT